MSQSRWFQGLGTVVSRGGGGKHGGFQAAGEAEAGIGHPRQTQLNALLAGRGVQAPWQAAAPGPSTACQRRAGKNPVWHHSLLGEFTAPLLSAALCHQVLLKTRTPENRTATDSSTRVCVAKPIWFQPRKHAGMCSHLSPPEPSSVTLPAHSTGQHRGSTGHVSPSNTLWQAPCPHSPAVVSLFWANTDKGGCGPWCAWPRTGSCKLQAEEAAPALSPTCHSPWPWEMLQQPQLLSLPPTAGGRAVLTCGMQGSHGREAGGSRLRCAC